MDIFGFEVCIREIKHYGKVDGNAILESFGGIIVDCLLSWNFLNKFYKVLFNQVIFKYFFIILIHISAEMVGYDEGEDKIYGDFCKPQIRSLGTNFGEILIIAHFLPAWCCWVPM